MAKVTVVGLKELEKALEELPKATGKNTLRRAGRKALGVFVEDAKARAPVRTGSLRDSISVSTKLSSRQKRLQKKLVSEGKAAVEIYGGATALPHAHLLEFGSVNNAPQPFMRPAWDSTQAQVLDEIKDNLATEIDKAAKRLAKKRAKAARG